MRVNPLEGDGMADLAGIAAPDVLMMSKVGSPEQVRRLEAAAPPGVALVPNIESARGLLRIGDIAAASGRVSALLVASEDMVVDLGTQRSRGGAELAYVRSRFLVECRAAGVEAIDCPYTFSDVKGAVAHAINAVFSPTRAELAKARKVVAAFERARAKGRDRAKVGGALIEVPVYAAAKRLLASAARS